jgi:CCR4-NOT transcription complex subunit 6
MTTALLSLSLSLHPTDGFTDCIDYVFVSGGVEVAAAEPLPAIERVAAGLPDLAHGSDHLPLTVELTF